QLGRLRGPPALAGPSVTTCTHAATADGLWLHLSVRAAPPASQIRRDSLSCDGGKATRPAPATTWGFRGVGPGQVSRALAQLAAGQQAASTTSARSALAGERAHREHRPGLAGR